MRRRGIDSQLETCNKFDIYIYNTTQYYKGKEKKNNRMTAHVAVPYS